MLKVRITDEQKKQQQQLSLRNLPCLIQFTVAQKNEAELKQEKDESSSSSKNVISLLVA